MGLTDVGNRDLWHENKAVCGTMLGSDQLTFGGGGGDWYFLEINISALIFAKQNISAQS